MKHKAKILGLFTLLTLIYTCKLDFVAIDLTDQLPVLLAPQNGYQTSTLTHTFWWEELEGASGYEIQIVSPSFSNIQALVLDSNTTDNVYTFTLSPGSYEWRLRAYNGNSTTAYVAWALTIDNSPDISTQVMVLNSPVNNLATNQLAMNFYWQTIPNADDYRFELYTPDFNGTEVIPAEITINDSTSHLFTAEGDYAWRVRGQNDLSNTPYTTYTFEIDTAAPNIPDLSLPLANDTVPGSSSIDFSWDRGAVTGSSITDSLLIYSDTTFTNLIKGYSTTNTSLNDSITAGAGDYFWGVRSFDAAGNKSDYSLFRKIIIQ